jgi:site-specific recombinase XerD
LKVEDVDFEKSCLNVYRSKGRKDRIVFMSDDVRDLCLRFHNYYSTTIPNRKNFFQPSVSKSFYTSDIVGKAFDSALKKTAFAGVPGKKHTPHGLRHLFAVQNIKKCAEHGESFANWMQYLCHYMGHKHIRYTQYYLHITSQLFPVYSKKLLQLEEGVGILYAEE